jgi:Zn-dependent protease with chaperone function
MHFLLLILLTLVCLPEAKDRSAPPEWLGTAWCIGLTWFGMAALVGTAAFLGQVTRRQLAENPGQRHRLLHRYASWRFYHLLGLFAVYGLALFGLGWGWVVASSLAEGFWAVLPGTEVLVLAPLLVALVLSWAFYYDVDKALHDADAGESSAPYWSRWGYLGFHIRHNAALVLVPLLLLITVKDLPRLLPRAVEQSELLVGILGLGTPLIILALMPLVLRLVLGLKPIPDGPLRRRLVASSRRLNFRCSEFLFWNTRSGIANAMLIGLFPRLRYVAFTDRLLAEMTPDEVEAVFGHEVGHVKHRHMLFYLGFLMISLLALSEIWQLADQTLAEAWQGTALAAVLDLEAHRDLALLPVIGTLAVYIFIVFGFLSRRCERQADIFGCRAVSCGQKDCLGHEGTAELASGGQGLCPTGILIFMTALEKVAVLNGISRDRPGWLQSWQHSTIARRVEFLQKMLVDPDLEPCFQRKLCRLKWALVLGLVGLLLLVGQFSGWVSFQSWF